jgi:4-alpha-glucanotransferase
VPARSALRALAARLGITSSYVALDGRSRVTSDDTRVAMLATMGFDASEERTARRALVDLEREAGRRLLDPVRVVVRRRAHPVIRLRGAGSGKAGVTWRVELLEEQGRQTVAEGRRRPGADGSLSIPLPANPAMGYHQIRAWVDGADGSRGATQRLIVAPSSCYSVGEALGKRRGFGIIAHLYTLRSQRNWGIGDLTDLGELAEWAGGIGAAFVGTNPLHALRNRDGNISPYSPVSRLFRNVPYLDVAAIPELRDAPEVRLRVAAPEVQEQLARCRATRGVDYQRVMELKLPLLEALFRVFLARHRGAGTERGRAYALYKEEQGSALERFATFLALDRHFAREGRRMPWQEWPAEFRDPRSAAVERYRAVNRDAIEFNCYLQFELDRQLAEVARRGSTARLHLGLYQDLAVGTAGDGSDPWAFPGLFVHDATVGSPPDDYSATGQDWGVPPVDPHRLADQQYDYWIRLLRAAFAHSGALRIDHAMGLIRLYWIPKGARASAGCYVRYPVNDLLGILALESRRRRAVVIGEDLGTVPRGFAALLARWGALSSRVLYFERTNRGAFRAAGRYSRRALVTATTHDHPPLEGFRIGRDLELRRQAGQISTDRSLGRLRAARRRELKALERRLRADGAMPRAAAQRRQTSFAEAVHTFLGHTPAPLVGVYLDDLVGETDPVNIPGVVADRYPGWSRRLSLPLERLASTPSVSAALRGLERRALR